MRCNIVSFKLLDVSLKLLKWVEKCLIMQQIRHWTPWDTLLDELTSDIISGLECCIPLDLMNSGDSPHMLKSEELCQVGSNRRPEYMVYWGDPPPLTPLSCSIFTEVNPSPRPPPVYLLRWPPHPALLQYTYWGDPLTPLSSSIFTEVTPSPRPPPVYLLRWPPHPALLQYIYWGDPLTPPSSRIFTEVTPSPRPPPVYLLRWPPHPALLQYIYWGDPLTPPSSSIFTEVTPSLRPVYLPVWIVCHVLC